MMKYVLDVQIAMQMGYGFSKHHCVPYSMIALQEANFIVNYPPIYWATAVLMTESGTIERESEEGDGKEGGTDYDSLGSAIANLQSKGLLLTCLISTMLLQDLNLTKQPIQSFLV